MYLPSPRVRELLTEATRQLGILKRISPPGVSPAQYELHENETLVAQFLGIEEKGAAEEVDEKQNGDKSQKSKGKDKPKGRGKGKGKEAKAATAEAAETPAEVPAPQPEAEEEPETISLVQAYDLLSTAISNSVENGRSLKLAAIKKQMIKLKPGFDETKLNTGTKPFKRFSEFVRGAEVAGVVDLKGRGTQAEVHLKA